MKTLKTYALIGTIALSMIFISCSKEEAAAPIQKPATNNSQNLSSAEEDFLLSSVEKQKLHRDLYDEMAKKNQDQIFTIHAKNDALYMEMLSMKVDKYGLNNPINYRVAGKYTNSQIQTTYDDFISKNGHDWEDLLLFAKKMEEMLIADVQQHLQTVSGHSDIVNIYSDLITESQNQLAALNIELRSIGDTNI